MSDSERSVLPLSGVVFFWTETGTEGGHWAFQDKNFITKDKWSYEGLHVLKDGDELVIFSKEDPSIEVWAGKILLKNYNPFTKHVKGLWVQSDQIGTDREVWATWFFREYPAKLITSSD